MSQTKAELVNGLSVNAAADDAITVDSSGRVLLGTTTEGEGDADDLTIASSGNTGITIRSGTSNDGAIFFSDGTSGNAEFEGTIQYLHGSNAMTFKTDHAERMRINSSGQIGMGTSNPVQQAGRGLHINGTDQARIKLTNSSSGATANDGFDIIQESGLIMHLLNHENSDFKFGTNDVERMRIRSTGGLMINDDGGTRIGEPKLHVLNGGASNNVASFFFNTTDDRDALIIRHNGAAVGSSRTQIKFLNDQGNQCGKIESDRNSTAYLSGSDYRLKENEVSISDGITRLKTLKPYRFNFKDNPSKIIDGFFAHEAQEVAPYAVSGEKDAEEMQAMDYGKLTPLLTAALQEAISEIETLKTEVAALKSQLNN